MDPVCSAVCRFSWSSRARQSVEWHRSSGRGCGNHPWFRGWRCSRRFPHIVGFVGHVLIAEDAVGGFLCRQLLFYELVEAVHVVVLVRAFLLHWLQLHTLECSSVFLKASLGRFETRLSTLDDMNWKLSWNNSCLPSMKSMYFSMLLGITLMSSLNFPISCMMKWLS